SLTKSTSLTKSNSQGETLVVYKLHRPLPTKPVTSGAGSSTKQDLGLWEAVQQHYPQQRIVIVSIDDLRDGDVSISRGLSWERTALDLVWQLLNADAFAALRESPHLIVRL